MSSVLLERKVSFSSGHRYWREDLTPEENKGLYGPWASPFNHGHNYVLWVGAEGPLDERTGMVVNIKRIDDCLKEVVAARFDQKSINDEVLEMKGVSPSVENLLRHFASCLSDLPGEARLVRLKLEETPLFYGEWFAENNMITLTRSYEFAASHRLHSEHLSSAENIGLYGKCNHIHGHGHNYVLEVTITGEIDPATGMMADLSALDEAVEERVLDRYDHKNLDVDVEELLGRVTTSEVVAQAIFDQLYERVPGDLCRVRLFETPRSAFEVTKPSASG
jgi:6-pyruvoyltetrahydropterin/6-carboxytetrahydropterin synthase